MSIERASFCKVNLLLNILGKRPDGFHELETLMQPIAIQDMLRFERIPYGIEFTCSNPALAAGTANLVHRAAELFLKAAGVQEGVRAHLEKHIPIASGLGGGSGNAATTLLALNELFGSPLPLNRLFALAVELGSDVPFFLQCQPALATGRGEKIEPIPALAGLKNSAFLLVHPGFGVSTPWAYKELARFPEVLNGRAGRARELAQLLNGGNVSLAAQHFYNSLEVPVLEKYPLLEIYQEFLVSEGAIGALMSGSGSTTFALVGDLAAAERLQEKFLAKFGPGNWTAAVRAHRA